MKTPTVRDPESPADARTTLWRRRTRTLLLLCGLGLLAPWATRAVPGTAARALWLLDLASHWQWLFMTGLLAGSALAMAIDRRWLPAALLLPLPFLAASPPLPSQDGAAGLTSFLLASANVHVSTTRVDRLAPWLAEAAPDAVVLLEVSPSLARELPLLAKDYPHQVVQPDDSPFGIALLSRHPLASPRVVIDEGGGTPRIETEVVLPGGQRVKLVAMHPMPPLSPHFHAVRDQALQSLARRHGGDTPALLAGDLNATPWSTAFQGLDALGWRRATGLRPTWPAWGQGVFGIPIDHVLASRHWRVAQGPVVGPDLGSDHRPVLVRLALEAGQAAR